MLVVQFDNVMTIDNTPMFPGVSYVVSEDLAQTMINEGVRGGVNLVRHSGFNAYEKRLRPNDSKAGQNVCLWRHNAFGDNLMITGLCAYLRLALGLKVHVVCAPHVMPIWLGMDRNIKPNSLTPTPIYFDACRNFYDWHVFWQAMLEENREPDQGNAIDDLWRFAGFDEDIGMNYRRPMLRTTPKVNGDAIGISLHSGNCTRTLPLEWNAELIEKLHDKFPDRKIIVMGDDKQKSKALDDLKLPAKNLVGKINFEQTMRVMEDEIGTVISPDSALLHLAEGLGIPNIGLWGLFHPDDRAKYYKHHTAIDGFEGCEHGPCRWHGMNKFPLDKCGRLRVPNHCNALTSIKTERVVEAVK